MVEFRKAVKLEKSTEIKNYLLDKNYVILTTEVPVGDIVEYGLDWVVDILNIFHDGVAEGFAHHEKWLNALNEHITILTRDFIGLKTDFLNLDAISLGEYYDLKFTHDKEILDKIKEKVGPVAYDLSEHIKHYDVLKELVLATYKDTGETNIAINLSLVNLGAAIDALEGQFAGKKNLFQLVWLLFDDPELFLYTVVDDMIVRFW